MFLDIAKEATHALLSIANIQYWREQHQYFAPNSDELALLHCWSLSLEEQFYLAWPLVIVAARKYGVAFSTIAVASLASLLASIVVSRTDASAVFFLTPFRIYEFGCGALILLVELRVKPGPAAANILSGAGLGGVVASVLMLRSDMPYLAVAALLTCIGAAATILAGSQTFASRLLVNRPMRAVGAISYSLYLCHWPIIFFARFIVGDGVDTAVGTGALLASMLVVASAMYVLVERRFIQAPLCEKLCRLRRGGAAAGGADAPDIPAEGLSVAPAGGATANHAPAGIPRQRRPRRHRRPRRRAVSRRLADGTICLWHEADHAGTSSRLSGRGRPGLPDAVRCHGVQSGAARVLQGCARSCPGADRAQHAARGLHPALAAL
jgi:hypothetical protein